MRILLLSLLLVGAPCVAQRITGPAWDPPLSNAGSVMTMGPAPLPPPAPRWTTWDKVAFAAAGSLILLDWGQTLGCARVRHACEEGNPILGRRASEGRINTLIGAAFAAYVGGALVLPKEERRGMIGLVALFELRIVIRNFEEDVRP